MFGKRCTRDLWSVRLRVINNKIPLSPHSSSWSRSIVDRKTSENNTWVRDRRFDVIPTLTQWWYIWTGAPSEDISSDNDRHGSFVNRRQANGPYTKTEPPQCFEYTPWHTHVHMPMDYSAANVVVAHEYLVCTHIRPVTASLSHAIVYCHGSWSWYFSHIRL